tara:strand:+ start:10549 stop:10944 length:396 start_codon:yes stop_codon:yes gene_type:complete
MIKFFKVIKYIVINTVSILAKRELLSKARFLTDAAIVLSPVLKKSAIIKNFKKVVELLDNSIPYSDNQSTKEMSNRINDDNHIAFKGFSAQISIGANGENNDGIDLKYVGKLGVITYDSKTKSITGTLSNK